MLQKIEDLCSATQGCQGTLVKVVLRPEVMKKIILCKNRKDQTLLIDVLKQELLMPMNFGLSCGIHWWMEVKVH